MYSVVQILIYLSGGKMNKQEFYIYLCDLGSKHSGWSVRALLLKHKPEALVKLDTMFGFKPTTS